MRQGVGNSSKEYYAYTYDFNIKKGLRYFH